MASGNADGGGELDSGYETPVNTIVSFGGSNKEKQGSLIETLIDDTTKETMPELTSEESHFYSTNIRHYQSQAGTYTHKPQFQEHDLWSNETMYSAPGKPAAKPVTRVTFQEAHLLAPIQITIQPPSPSPSNRSEREYWETPKPRTQIPRSQSTDSRDNPFQPDGDLSKEAEAMLKASTIKRDQVLIVDSPDADKSKTQFVLNESYEGPEPGQEQNKENVQTNDVDIKLKENGNVEDNIEPQKASDAAASPPKGKAKKVKSPKKEVKSPKKDKKGAQPDVATTESEQNTAEQPAQGETANEEPTPSKAKDKKCCTIL